MTLNETRSTWEELAAIDPMWAVLSWKNKKRGQWSADEFFATGEIEIDDVILRGEVLKLPASKQSALDFGCGLGRLSRPLARKFESCVGLDISERMIDLARELNKDIANLSFIHTVGDDLASFSDNSFDLVYTNRVLQHLPSTDIVHNYVVEFLRVLRPGGLLVFGLPTPLGLAYRLAPSRILFRILKLVGLPPQTIYERFGIYPVPMLGLDP